MADGSEQRDEQELPLVVVSMTVEEAEEFVKETEKSWLGKTTREMLRCVSEGIRMSKAAIPLETPTSPASPAALDSSQSTRTTAALDAVTETPAASEEFDLSDVAMSGYEPEDDFEEDDFTLVDAEMAYPSQCDLKAISEWKPSDGPEAWLKLVDAVWIRSYGRSVWFVEGGKNYFRLSTGGWSGNEDIIRAMRENFALWHVTWEASFAGGGYLFCPEKYE